MNTINDLVNEALAQWAALTGATTEYPTGRQTMGEYEANRELQEEAIAINESRDLDPSGVTTFMLLRNFASRYAKALTITAQDFLNDPASAMAQLQALKALLAVLDHKMALATVDEFKGKLRDAARHYGVDGENLEHIEVILSTRPVLLATLRRDALRSLETLEAHQFTQGNPDPMGLGFSPDIYEFWNMNSLLRAMAGLKIPGIALCLLRDPVSRFFNHYVISIRNGDTITVLTDREKHAHPGYREMARRPDKEFYTRINRHWFPYHLMKEVTVSPDGKGLYLAQSTELVPVNDQAMVIGRVRDIDPASFIWLILVFELVQARYGEQNLQLPETSYTGEMVANPNALVGSNSDLVRVGSYQPLEVAPLTAADITSESMAEQWADEGAKGVNQWMLDRYAHLVPDHVLNPIGTQAALEAMQTLALPGVVEGQPLAARPTGPFPKTNDVTLESAYLQGNYLSRVRGDDTQFATLDAISFGTKEDILRDRKWAARVNQVRVVQALALREFDQTRDEVTAWFLEKIKANLPCILDAVTTGSWKMSGIHPYCQRGDPDLETLEHEMMEQVLAPYTGQNPFREFTPCHDVRGDLPRGVYVGRDHCDIIITGKRTRREGFHCYDNEDLRANAWTTIRPRGLEAVSAITGVPFEEFPWQVKTWAAARPYTGNSILRRLDPADHDLVNPWDSFTFRIVMVLSKRALDARRRAKGLPKAELEVKTSR